MFFFCVSSVVAAIKSEKARTQGPEGIPSKGKIKVKILQKTKVSLKEEKPQHLEDMRNVGFFM